MSESTEAVETNEQIFQIQKIYTKNVSFESPNAPEIFTEEFEPSLEFDLNVASGQLAEGVFHVVVMVTATIKVGEKVAFLCEVEQAGIFTLEGFNEQELTYILGAQCPTVLFPYARESVSDLVNRGGFPPLLLDPVNFDAMFAEQLELAQQSQAEATV